MAFAPTTTTPRIATAVLAGALTGAITGTADTDPGIGVLVGIAVTAAVFVTLGWLALWPMDATETRSHAAREDYRPAVDEVIVVVAALSALGGIVGLLIEGGSHAEWLPALVALLGVFLAWASVHLMYAARYANLYYTPLDDPPEAGAS